MLATTKYENIMQQDESKYNLVIYQDFFCSLLYPIVIVKQLKVVSKDSVLNKRFAKNYLLSAPIIARAK